LITSVVNGTPLASFWYWIHWNEGCQKR
jgi:hypothetical protein